MKKLSSTWRQQKANTRSNSAVKNNQAKFPDDISEAIRTKDDKQPQDARKSPKAMANRDSPRIEEKRRKLQASKSVSPVNKENKSPEKKRKSPVNKIAKLKPDAVENGATNGVEIKSDLAEWDLPAAVIEAYAEKGIVSLFDWQAECLSIGNAMKGGNLVYSAPTSAGKTMVAEILVLKKVLEGKKKALIILPFVSIAREKMFYLQALFQNAGVRVDGYMGSHNPPGGFASVDIAVCTIEKANGLVNRLLEEEKLDQLGILVVDELHMVGDPHRGYLLELLLTKVLFSTAGKTGEDSTQIVGMSATLPNLNELAAWLKADLYRTDFRPVPLQEFIKIGNNVYDTGPKDSPLARQLPNYVLRSTGKEDLDHAIYLCLETITQGNSVLMFCPAKQWCENMAQNIAREIYAIGNATNNLRKDEIGCEWGPQLRSHLNGSKLSDVCEQLKRCPAGLDSILSLTVPFGVAFHHAGLTFDERDIIEGAYRLGNVKVLVATTTLSSGVNLPARRVIIRSPLAHGQSLDVLCYKQMAGRAGRQGVDTRGESLLLCKETERTLAAKLLASAPNPVRSCLIKSTSTSEVSLSSSLKRAILEAIASDAVTNPQQVELYASCTLLATQLARDNDAVIGTDNNNSGRNTKAAVQLCIDYLKDHEFIYTRTVDEEVRYGPSRLGKAVLSSSLAPDEALSLLRELKKAHKCFVLENELHLVYQVTPPFLMEQLSSSVDWMGYLSLWDELPLDMKKVGELVGVEERFLANAIRGVNRAKCGKALAVHLRFYAALALHDLVQEVKFTKVVEKYKIPRGVLQSLQQSAATFSGMVCAFCKRLGWKNMELLIKQFQQRLHFGVQQELCDLLRVSALNAQMARIVYDAGYETPSALAKAYPRDIEIVLKNAKPFQSEKKSSEDDDDEGGKSCRFWIAGMKGVNERQAAQLMVREAQFIVEKDLGVEIINWNKKSPSIDTSVNKSDIEPIENEHTKIIPKFNPTKPLVKLKEIDPLVIKSTETESSVIKSTETEPYVIKSKVTEPSVSKFKETEPTVSKFKETEPTVSKFKETEPPVSKFKETEPTVSKFKETEPTVSKFKETEPPVSKSKETDIVRKNEHPAIKPKVNRTKSVIKSNETQSINSSVVKDIVRENDSKHRRTKPTFNLANSVTKATDPNIQTNQTPHLLDRIHDDQNLQDSVFESRKSTNYLVRSRSITPLVLPITPTAGASNNSVFRFSDSIDLGFNTTSTPCVSNPASKIQFTVKTFTKAVSKLATSNIDNITVSNFVHAVKEVSERLASNESKKSSSSEKVFSEFEDFNMSMGSDFSNACSPEKIKLNSHDHSKSDSSKSFQGSEDIFASPVLVVDGVARKTTSPSPINEINPFGINKDQVCRKNDSKSSNIDHPVRNVTHESNQAEMLIEAVGYSFFESQMDESLNIDNPFRKNTSKSSPIFDHIPKAQHSESTNFGNRISETNFVEQRLKNRTSDTNFIDDMGSTFFESGGFSQRDYGINNELRLSSSDGNGRKMHSQSSSNVSFKDGSSDGNQSVSESSDLFSDHSRTSLRNSLDRMAPITTESSYIDTQTQKDDFNNAIFGSEGFNLVQTLETPPKNALVKSMEGRDMFGDSILDLSAGFDVYSRPNHSENQGIGSSVLAGLENMSSFEDCGSPSSAKVENDCLKVQTNDSQTHCKFVRASEVADNAPNTTNKVQKALKTSINVDKSSISAIKMRTNLDKLPKTKTIVEKEIQNSFLNDIDCDVFNETFGESPKSEKSDLNAKEFENRTILSDDSYNAFLQENHEDLEDNCDTIAPTPLTKTQSKSSLQSSSVNSSQVFSEVTGVRTRSQKADTQSQKCTGDGFCIIDVTTTPQLFRVFLDEWKEQNTFSLSIACEKRDSAVQLIEDHYILDESSLVEDDCVVGFSVCWGSKDAYYVSFLDLPGDPASSSRISKEERTKCLYSGLKRSANQGEQPITVGMFDSKTQLNILSRFNNELTEKIVKLLLSGKEFNLVDPKVAEWLSDPSAKEKTLHSLVVNYLPQHIGLLSVLSGTYAVRSVGITTSNKDGARLRSTLESVLVFHISNYILVKLNENCLEKPFHEIEMPTLIVLSQMDQRGIGYDPSLGIDQKRRLTSHLSTLEKIAFKMAKRSFNFISPKDVSKVLYKELRLPNRDSRNGGTGKDALAKLKQIHPLPAVILEWRKVSCAINKVLNPLLKSVSDHPKFGANRIIGESLTLTATGRISMREPNIQNIPRDFELTLIDAGEHLDPDRSETISLRDAFVPYPGGIFVSADYSQLELRILAHLSDEARLKRILNSGDDVFVSIAAQWLSIPKETVNKQQRHRAKQICYGIIYGIGTKTLAEQLEVEESEAIDFVNLFHENYPGIRPFVASVISQCRERGYVETIFGRRRYLVNISSANSVSRSAAERQAVNTRVQGSAADLVKKATIEIHRDLDNLTRQEHPIKDDRVCDINLVLQLHDELIYEVPERLVSSVAGVIKREMEGVAPEGIILPVNIKKGHKWGTLIQFQI